MHYMVDGGQINLALLMVGGAWVEGMYLILGSVGVRRTCIRL